MADLSKPGNKDNDTVMVDFLPANDAVTKGNPKRKTNDANVRKQAQAGQEPLQAKPKQPKNKKAKKKVAKQRRASRKTRRQQFKVNQRKRKALLAAAEQASRDGDTVEPTAGTLTASAPNLVGQQASSTTELCNAHIAQGKNESKDTEMGGLNTQDVTAGASGTVQGSIYSLTLAFRSKA